MEFQLGDSFCGSSEQILLLVLYCVIYACITLTDTVDVITVVIILLLSDAGSPISKLLGLYDGKPRLSLHYFGICIQKNKENDIFFE